jgi:predicted nucleic acid-binding protein
MTVLDTNVLSEIMQHEADPSVVAWFDRQPRESTWTTAVTVFEIRFGLELLAHGRRRRQLEEAFQRALDEEFHDRILSFDRDAALEAASRSAKRRLAGKSLDSRDLEIAGIVAARGATLATRNTRHFQDLGLELVDPWTSR